MFTDAILFVPNFPSLVGYLNEHHPEMLERDEDGNINDPPIVTGFARTPAAIRDDRVMVYARLRPNEIEEWRGIPGVEVLGEAEFTGPGTAEKVYGQVFNDPEKLAKYDSVHDRSITWEDEESDEEYTQEQPWFGVLAGA